MPKKRSRVFSRAFKLAAVSRMMGGEDVSARRIGTVEGDDLGRILRPL
jgi:hypothetical protein